MNLKLPLSPPCPLRLCLLGLLSLSALCLCAVNTSKVCSYAGDVRTFLSQRQVIVVSSSLSWGVGALCLWHSHCGECNVLVLQTDTALRLCNHSPQSGTELHPPGWWCLNACRVCLQNVNLPPVLTSAAFITCGISLDVTMMLNVKLVNSTNKPNKQLSLVGHQLFSVGREGLVFLYCSGAQCTHCCLQQFSAFKMYCREALFQLKIYWPSILLSFCAMSVKWAKAKKYSKVLLYCVWLKMHLVCFNYWK